MGPVRFDVAGKRADKGLFREIDGLFVAPGRHDRYRSRMVPGHPVEAQGWITLRPRYGLRMTLEKRVSEAGSAL